MKRLVLAAALTLAALPASAQGVQQWTAKKAPQPKPDAAYIVLRTIVPKGTFAHDLVIVRLGSSTVEPTNPKRAQNVVRVNGSKALETAGEERTFALELPPGTYVLAGQAFLNGGANGTCLCMGTVKFDVRAGEATDLGHVLAARDDRPTQIPELAAHVRGFNIGVEPMPYVLAIRPPVATQSLPAALQAMPRALADYRAFAAFPNYFGASVDRLVPLKGVLDYDRAKIVDLKQNVGESTGAPAGD